MINMVNTTAEREDCRMVIDIPLNIWCDESNIKPLLFSFSFKGVFPVL